jgi:L-aspartate oxidase
MTDAYDVLVIGSGAAGLTAALSVLEAKPGAKVAVVSKKSLAEGSTMHAQGGIAAALDRDDSPGYHVTDTLVAGAGLCDRSMVEFIVEHGGRAIDWLIAQGVGFDREGGGYHLTREGGHSRRRVVHAADATGRAVETALVERARNSGAIILEDRIAVDLIRERLDGGRRGRCIGAYALDRSRGRVELLPARTTILATGGASRVYLYSSNPDGSTGDGIAMGWRAGCRVANMEFSQFHPTCLYHPHAKSFLITEAVRGEGGRLLRPDGTRFMDEYDARGELAPRDIVARAIDDVMKRLGCDHVYLDISHKPAEFIQAHFPTIHATCLELGIDITREPIPVVPAAHFTCGGVLADRFGHTDVENLYAVGEVACTGLHGANRLASNSLLECVVVGRSAGATVAETLDAVPPPPAVPVWDESWVTDSDEEVVVAHNWDEIRRFMWDYVGIVRSTKRLERAKHRIKLLLGEIGDYYGSFRVTNDLLELRNIATVADLIVRSALARKESRGLHFTIDFPAPDTIAPPQNTILVPKGFSTRRAPVGEEAQP